MSDFPYPVEVMLDDNQMFTYLSMSGMSIARTLEIIKDLAKREIISPWLDEPVEDLYIWEAGDATLEIKCRNVNLYIEIVRHGLTEGYPDDHPYMLDASLEQSCDEQLLEHVRNAIQEGRALTDQEEVF